MKQTTTDATCTNELHKEYHQTTNNSFNCTYCSGTDDENHRNTDVPEVYVKPTAALGQHNMEWSVNAVSLQWRDLRLAVVARWDQLFLIFRHSSFRIRHYRDDVWWLVCNGWKTTTHQHTLPISINSKVS